jgi:Protein of unknown function (DUF1353)
MVSRGGVEVMVIGRRGVFLGSATLTIENSRIFEAFAAPPPKDEKAAFIDAAMKEILKAIDDEDKRKESRGDFSSIAPPPMIVPFLDWDYYYTKDGPIRWSPNQGQSHQAVTVPPGFISDLASVPRVFWSILPKQGRYAYAAMVHDYLYWVQIRSKDESDTIFKIAMEDLEVGPTVTETLYRAVSLAGGSAWSQNAKLKASGERRFLKRFPPTGDISWATWKKENDVFAD